MKRFLPALLLLLAATPARPDEPAYDWMLTFHNGDTVHCRLNGLANDRLSVNWAIAPETPVAFELKAIAQLTRAEATTTPSEKADVLRLHDGSTILGRTIRFGAKRLEFEVEALGKLVLDTANVLELSRGTHDFRIPEMREGEFLVATRGGNVLTGKLETDEMGQLLLKSDGMTATIDQESVEFVLFPRPVEAAPDDDDDQEKPARAAVQVKLRDGSLLGGREPVLEQDVLRFKLRTGHEVRAPLSELVQISFIEDGELVGRGSLRSVLVWGRWADKGDEYRKTVNIIQQEFEGKWKITESMTEKFDRKFRRELFSVRTLVIPEMEKLKAPNPVKEAQELRPLIASFVRGGGNVVICGVQAQHVNWVKEAGLFDLSVKGQVDGQQIAFSPEGAKVGRGLPGGWRAVNATFGYEVGNGIKAQVLASAGGRAVVVGRRIGRGWIICIGADFYMTSKETSQVLANAISIR